VGQKVGFSSSPILSRSQYWELVCSRSPLSTGIPEVDRPLISGPGAIQETRICPVTTVRLSNSRIDLTSCNSST